MAGFERPAGHLGRFVPTLTTRYHRSTLLLTTDSRATIDIDLAFTPGDGADDGAPVACGGPWAVIESKSMGRPTAMDWALWSMGERPVPLSKYSAGIALFRPELPANHWNRPLRRHFSWEPKRDDARPAVTVPEAAAADRDLTSNAGRG